MDDNTTPLPGTERTTTERILNAALNEATKVIAAFGGSHSPEAWSKRLTAIGARVVSGGPGLNEAELAAIAGHVKAADEAAQVEPPQAESPAVAKVTSEGPIAIDAPRTVLAPVEAPRLSVSSADLGSPLIALGELLAYVNPDEDQLSIAAFSPVVADYVVAGLRYVIGQTPTEGSVTFDLYAIPSPGHEPVPVALNQGIACVGGPAFGVKPLTSHIAVPAGNLLVARITGAPADAVDLYLCPVGIANAPIGGAR